MICHSCFKNKAEIIPLPADMIGQVRSAQRDSPMICKSCWYDLDKWRNWLSFVADIDLVSRKDQKEPAVDISEAQKIDTQPRKKP